MEGRFALFRQDKLVVAGDSEPVFLLIVDEDDLPACREKRARVDPGNRRAPRARGMRLSDRVHEYNSLKGAVKPLPL